MFDQDGNMVTITEIPSGINRPFNNPVCKGTYESLPRIYGAKDKKKFILDIK
jgi:hypothetical protein